MMRAARAAALALALASMAAPASAHTVGLSRGTYRPAASGVAIELVFARAELVTVVPSLDADRDGVLGVGELRAGRSALATVLVAPIRARSGAGCTATLDDAALLDEDGVALRGALACPSGAPASLSLGFLSNVSMGHRHLADVVDGTGAHAQTTAYEAQPEIALGAVAAPPSGFAGVALPLFRLGLEHILTGYDHLVFLLGLVIVGGRVRSQALVVTSFTLAHSITLGLAALGAMAPSPRLVEPAIALSIAYVGIENWFAPNPSRRWMITFPFGLIHGFGFAGALHEVALPSGQVPLALFAFNAGVEAGQLAVLCVALPAVLWLSRRPWFARDGVRAVSAVVAVAGLVWFASRVA